MAQLPDHDLMLDLRLETWRAVPDTLKGVMAWDADERRDFLLELAVEENILAYLTDQAAQGQLNPAQIECLAEVQALVAVRRPILDAYLTSATRSAPSGPTRLGHTVGN
jgi:hypothetical protein